MSVASSGSTAVGSQRLDRSGMARPPSISWVLPAPWEGANKPMSLTDRVRGADPLPPLEASRPVATPTLPSGPAAPPSQAGNGAPQSPTMPGSLPFQEPRTHDLDPPPLTLRTAGISRELKTRVRDQLIDELGPDVREAETDEVRQRIKAHFDRLLANESVFLSRVERERLLEAVTADLIGYGPIEPLLKDPRITEVMVNGPDQVYVE